MPWPKEEKSLSNRQIEQIKYTLEYIQTPEGKAYIIDQLILVLEEDLEENTNNGMGIIGELWGKSPYRFGVRPTPSNKMDSPEIEEHLTL